MFQGVRVSEPDATHERAVDEFLRQAAARTGATTDDEFKRWLGDHEYPVLTESELDWRRSREVRLSEAFENTLALSSDMGGRRLGAPINLRGRLGRVASAAA